MLIGRVLVFPYEFETVFEKKVKSEWFTSEKLKEIFEKAEKQYFKNGKCQISVENIDDDLLDNLYNYGEYALNIDGVIEELRKEHFKNYLNQKITEIIKRDDIGTDEKTDTISSILDKINDSEDENYQISTPTDLLTSWIAETEKRTLNGIKSPFENMHEYFHFLGGYLVVLGARPSMGKTALGLTFFKETAKKHNSLFVNLEMQRKELTSRLIAGEADVALNRLQSKDLTDFEIKKMAEATSVIENLKMLVLDCTKNIFEEIVVKIMSEHKKQQFKLIVIDYLTLMRSRKNFQNRNLEVEYMANYLKMLAKKLNTCIVVLAQLNREKESNGVKNKKPDISNIRDSGGVEQAADVIGLLYREDYYNEEMRKEDFVILELLIRKNRQGKLGDIEFGYQKSSQRITGVMKK